MKFHKILSIFAALALIIVPSCSDDDLKSPLTATEGASEDVSYTSLSFKWDKVDGAVQYGYQLSKAGEDVLETGVTKKNAMVFTGLTPATEYELKVWAFADVNSSQTTSEPIVMRATTLEAAQLATPEVSVKIEGKYINATWPKVANAKSYKYALRLGDETIETGTETSRSIWFQFLEKGTYTLSVQAISTKEGIVNSQVAETSFTIEAVELWRVRGLYTSKLLDSTWNATLVAYSDNTYSLQGWYVVQGYDLDFYIDTFYPDNAFLLTGDYAYDENTYLYSVPTGRTDLKSVNVYPWYNYCSISGDKDGGAMSLCVYSDKLEDYVYDSFVWGESTKAPADEFTGTWTLSISGQTQINENWSWENFSYEWDIQVTKVDDNTIRMPALYFSDVMMDVTINMDKKTLTVTPFTVWDYYTFASDSSASDPVVGKINDDGTLEFTGWNAWCDGYQYLWETKATLKR